MENFVIYNPVKLHFGQGVVSKLGDVATNFGKKALIVMGRGSARSNGSFDQSYASLKAAGIEVVIYEGIRSNPIIEDVDQAAEMGRKEKADMVIAIGGGSVVDSAKIIAISIPAEHSGWDFVDGSKKPSKALPLISVLTLAATGSEMNAYAVVQHNKLKKKIGYGHQLLYPRHSFLDPGFTLGVPPDYTAYGIADLVAHSLEAWFGEGESSLTDRFIISIIQEAMDYGPDLLKNPNNYQLRAKIMYAATMALNGLTVHGKKSQDWGVHSIGHCLSVLWDIPHGASLTIAYPAWLELQKSRIPQRISELGKCIFQVSEPDKVIEMFSTFFSQMNCPVTLSQAGIKADDGAIGELLEVMRINKVGGIFHTLSDEDHRQLARSMR